MTKPIQFKKPLPFKKEKLGEPAKVLSLKKCPHSVRYSSIPIHKIAIFTNTKQGTKKCSLEGQIGFYVTSFHFCRDPVC